MFLEYLNKVSTLVKYVYSIEDIFYLLAFWELSFISFKDFCRYFIVFSLLLFEIIHLINLINNL